MEDGIPTDEDRFWAESDIETDDEPIEEPPLIVGEAAEVADDEDDISG